MITENYKGLQSIAKDYRHYTLYSMFTKGNKVSRWDQNVTKKMNIFTIA